VTIGVLIDVVGTMALGFIGSLAFGIYLVTQGLRPDQLEHYLAGISSTSAFSIVFTVLGLLMSVLAGYVCARIVRHHEYKTALLAGILSSLIGLVLSFGYHSFWFGLLSVFSTLAAVLAGAWMYVRAKPAVPAAAHN
jgi:hypothetical protein